MPPYHYCTLEGPWGLACYVGSLSPNESGENWEMTVNGVLAKCSPGRLEQMLNSGYMYTFTVCSGGERSTPFKAILLGWSLTTRQDRKVLGLLLVCRGFPPFMPFTLTGGE